MLKTGNNLYLGAEYLSSVDECADNDSPYQLLLYNIPYIGYLRCLR
jgi:soluble lytic murein transglycosylase-like protein